MMRYEWVVALVVAALLLAPVVGAAWVILVGALRSPLVKVVSAAQRTYALVMVGVLGAYSVYISWATVHRWEPTTNTIMFIVGWCVSTALLCLVVGSLCWRILGAHAAFDGRPCTPGHLRRALRQYYLPEGNASNVTLSVSPAGDRVRVEVGDRKTYMLNPAAHTSAAALVAAAYTMYGPEVDKVILAKEGEAVRVISTEPVSN